MDDNISRQSGKVPPPAWEWGAWWWAAWLNRNGWRSSNLQPGAGNGGTAASAQSGPAAGANGDGGASGGHGGPDGGQPCGELQPADLVDPAALDEAMALEALGERREFARRMEGLFVDALRRLLECEGEAAAASVVHDLAYILHLSPETLKRYLKKHASRWGPFEVVGDVVRLRRAGDVG